MSHEVTGFANPSLTVGGSSAAATQYSHTEYTLSVQAQLGSFLVPETPMDSMGEIFSKLQEAAATYDQRLATLSITHQSFLLGPGLVAAINFMRMPASAFSGLNTRTGSLLTIKLNMRIETQKMYAHLVGTVLVEIRADSCFVYD